MITVNTFLPKTVLPTLLLIPTRTVVTPRMTNLLLPFILLARCVIYLGLAHLDSVNVMDIGVQVPLVFTRGIYNKDI